MSRAFTVIECEQGSPEWFTARLGRVTGSRASDMTATVKTKGEEAAKRRDLRMQLVCERLTNQCQEDQFVNADMRRGTELEPDARRAYEAATGDLVLSTGFLSHNSILCGASLDGHVGDLDLILELKVPRPATHLRYVRAGVLPPEHRFQVLHNLFVSGAPAAEFVSFCPAFPEAIQLFRVRVARNEAELQAYELILSTFLTEIEKEVEAVRTLIRAA